MNLKTRFKQWTLKSLSIIIFTGILLSSIPVSIAVTPTLIAASSSMPVVVNASVQEQQTSLQLPAGSQVYIFGYGTGGARQSSSFNTGQYASVTNANGYMVASLAITTSNSNAFTTSTSYQVIGGVAVSGFSSYTSSYGSNGSSSAASASRTFTVDTAGSLVVVVAIGGDEHTLTLTGISGIQIDASYPDSPNLAMVIAHAYLNPGQYTVTENTQQTAAGQDPNNAGDLIGVFVFVPSTTSPTVTPTPTLTPTPTPTLTFAPTPTPTPTPTSTPTPVSTPTPTPTLIPTPTGTAISTPTPTLTLTSTPTPIPTATSPSHVVIFKESGLPSGRVWYKPWTWSHSVLSWSVTLNGTSKTSNSGTITFTVPDGTYEYSVASIVKSGDTYSPLPPSGDVIVNEDDVNQAITFTLIPGLIIIPTPTPTSTLTPTPTPALTVTYIPPTIGNPTMTAGTLTITGSGYNPAQKTVSLAFLDLKRNEYGTFSDAMHYQAGHDAIEIKPDGTIFYSPPGGFGLGGMGYNVTLSYPSGQKAISIQMSMPLVQYIEAELPANLSNLPGGTVVSVPTNKQYPITLLSTAAPSTVPTQIIIAQNAFVLILPNPTPTLTPTLIYATESANRQNGNAPLTVQFTGQASGGQLPYFYSWDFGDGSSSKQQNPSHIYQTDGTYSATLIVIDNLGHVAQSSGITITVGSPKPLQMTTTSLKSGELRAFYWEQLDAVGGTVPYNWSIIANSALINSIGLILSSDGVLSGTLSNYGTIQFIVQVQDSVGAKVSKEFTLTIGQGPTLICPNSQCSLPEAIQGSWYSFALQGQGGTTPYDFYMYSGSLPSGLRLSLDGIISGIPISAVTDDYFAILMLDSLGGRSTQILSLTVEPASSGVYQTTFAFSTGNVAGNTPAISLEYNNNQPNQGLLTLGMSSVRLATNVSVSFTGGSLPNWLYSILGISNPWYSIKISDDAGVVDTGRLFQLNTPSTPIDLTLYPGTPTNTSALNLYHISFTASPSTQTAMASDLVSAICAVAGVNIKTDLEGAQFMSDASLYLAENGAITLLEFSQMAGSEQAAYSDNIFTSATPYLINLAAATGGGQLSLQLEKHISSKASVVVSEAQLLYDVVMIIGAIAKGDIEDDYVIYAMNPVQP